MLLGTIAVVLPIRPRDVTIVRFRFALALMVAGLLVSAGVASGPAAATRTTAGPQAADNAPQDVDGGARARGPVHDPDPRAGGRRSAGPARAEQPRLHRR